MQRPIKFRGWVDGKMGEPFDLYEELNSGLDVRFGWKPGTVFLQYTGLKDRNGTPIFEGDILGKRPYGYLKSDGTKDGRYKGREWNCFAVEWGEWSNEDLNLASGYEYESDGKVAGWNITFGNQYDDELKNYEVIGNIYQNKELLGSAT